MARALGLTGAAVLVSVLVGAGNAGRAACWTQTDGWVCGPLAHPAVVRTITPVAGLVKIEAMAPSWRPLRFSVRGSSPATDGAGFARIADHPTLAGAVTVPNDGQVVEIVTAAPDTSPNRLVLWAEADRFAAASVEIAAVAPEWSPRSAAVAFALGAAATFVLLWGAGRVRVAAEAGSHARYRLTAADAALALTVLVVYLAWAVLKPPLQSPDEPQHQARATSILASPFVGGAWHVTVAPAHRNPLTWTPNRLHGIIQKPEERLSAADVASLRSTPWRSASHYPTAERLTSGVASYPPTYYWAVFGGGEALTAGLGLTPYTSVIAYRVVSALLAWTIWLAVLSVLASAPETRAWARPAWLVLAATPTVATFASSVNPDALVIPATVLLVVLAWRVLATGAGAGRLVASAALAVAIKPSGLLALAAVGVAAAVWAYWGPADRDRAWLVGRRLAAVGAAAWIVFYAWSPPRLTPVPGSRALPIADYAASLWQRLPQLWVELWGRLGWQEYAAAPAWYWTVLAAVLALAVLAVWRRQIDGALARYALVTTGVYMALVIGGELMQHAHAGLMLQGRYFAPAALPLALLVAHDRAWRATRWVLPGLLAGLHVALAVATVDRYFDGDWSLWWRSISGGS